MPSKSFDLWRGSRRVELDELEHAHRRVGGIGRGRRTTTRQINHAYTLLLSSQFQGFCRDLHTESAELLASGVPNPGLRGIFMADLLLHRRLDQGNPNPGNLGADFRRLGLDLWDELRRADSRNETRSKELLRFVEWRNAVAHQRFVGGTASGRIGLADVRRWRRLCDQVAKDMDGVLGAHLAAVLGASPW